MSSPTDRPRTPTSSRRCTRTCSARYPKLHAALKREVVGGLSLLYTWPGSDPAAKPILLMAHQDVVPIAPGTEKNWQAEPFAGTIKDGFVWGRGAWDDKANLIAQLEAVEMLRGLGLQAQAHRLPGLRRRRGSGRPARRAGRSPRCWRERQVQLDFVLDEGLLITDGVLPGLKAPVAIVGIAEKGYPVVRSSASRRTPGHSSMPPPRARARSR